MNYPNVQYHIFNYDKYNFNVCFVYKQTPQYVMYLNSFK